MRKIVALAILGVALLVPYSLANAQRQAPTPIPLGDIQIPMGQKVRVAGTNTWLRVERGGVVIVTDMPIFSATVSIEQPRP